MATLIIKDIPDDAMPTAIAALVWHSGKELREGESAEVVAKREVVRLIGEVMKSHVRHQKTEARKMEDIADNERIEQLGKIVTVDIE